MPKKVRPIPKGYHTVTASMNQANAAATIEFCKKAFGAKVRMNMVGPGKKIMHAEIEIGNSRFYVNDLMMGKGPKEYGGSPASFWLYVPDADLLFNQAMAAGAEVRMPLEDQFWGDRAGAIADPEGYSWWIATRKEDLTAEEITERMMETFKKMPQPTT